MSQRVPSFINICPIILDSPQISVSRKFYQSFEFTTYIKFSKIFILLWCQFQLEIILKNRILNLMHHLLCSLFDWKHLPSCILTSVEVILGQLSTESSAYALCSKMNTKTVLFLIVVNLKNVMMTALFLKMKFTINRNDKLVFRFGI